MADLEQIKDKNPIEDVVQDSHPLRGGGKYLRSERHNSLVVDTHAQAYYWNSQGEQGDVISWVMARNNCDFKTACEILCERAGLPLPTWGTRDSEAAQARRSERDALMIAVKFFQRKLNESKAGKSYCCSRGWETGSISDAMLGLSVAAAELRDEFSLRGVEIEQNKAAKAALQIKPNMLIYPHIKGGRVVYLSARSIQGKDHFNPPQALIGERQVYANWLYSPRERDVVVVEGQADAITLGQWGIPAIALAGVSAGQDVLKMLAQHQNVYVALDNDEAGLSEARKVCDAIGPLTHLVRYPKDIKDANDWLQKKATADDFRAAMKNSTMWVMILAREAHPDNSNNGDHLPALDRAFRQIRRIDNFALAAHRDKLAKAMGAGIRQFNNMLKEAKERPDENAQQTPDNPLITQYIAGGIIPVPNSENEEYYLVETIYQPPQGAVGAAALRGGRTFLAIRDPEGKITTATHLDVGNTRYFPAPATSDLIRKRVVSFAPEVGPELKTTELINAIKRVIHKYIELTPFFEQLSAYYVLLTWFYDAFNIVPYLRFRGDYGTGKSRARKVVGGCCFRPMRSSGAATDASLFRMMDVWKGTLLMEEADYDKSDYATMVVKMLNQGYDREQGIILRCADRAKDFETEAFVCYGPKILAMRGEFVDKALESRCLTEEMRPKSRKDIPRELPREFFSEELPKLHSYLLRYRMKHWKPAIEIDEESVAGLAVEDRLIQITLSLFAIVDDEDLRAQLKDYLAEYNRKMIDFRGQTIAARVMEALVIQFEMSREGDLPVDAEAVDLSTSTLSDVVNRLIDYENFGQESYLKFHGKTEGVTSRRVGSVIRKDLQLDAVRRSKFNGRFVVVWDEDRIQGLRQKYGIDQDRLSDLLEMYMDIEALEANKSLPQDIPFS